MSAALPTVDSCPRAVMLSSALQPTSTITTASLAPGPSNTILKPAAYTHLHTHTQSVRNFTHIYSFVQQCSEANLHMYSCSCRHKTQKLLSALHIHTRMHSAGSQESSRFMQPALNNIRAEVGRPWTEIWNSFCHKKQILINVYCTDRLQK